MIEDTLIAACELWIGVSVNIVETLKMLNESFKSEEAEAALEKLKSEGLVD